MKLSQVAAITNSIGMLEQYMEETERLIEWRKSHNKSDKSIQFLIRRNQKLRHTIHDLKTQFFEVTITEDLIKTPPRQKSDDGVIFDSHASI